MQLRTYETRIRLFERRGGKFYRKNAEVRPPIDLDAKVQAQLERLARKNGKEVGEMVNQLVQKEMQLIDKLT
jgi:hypothetical protein